MRKKHSAFTLIEMVVVMTIILVLSSLVVAVVGYVNRKTAMSRATSEIATLQLACLNYKADAGRYPQDTLVVTTNSKAVFTKGDTDKLSPKQHFNPTSSEYSKAGEYLYQQLTGDKTLDGIPDDGEPIYIKDFDQRMLKADRDPTTAKIIRVYYFWDPFGYAYGYSTAAMFEEQTYQTGLKEGSAPPRKTGANLPGYNLTTYDLWSTVGSKLTTAPTTDALKESEQAKWLKNW